MRSTFILLALLLAAGCSARQVDPRLVGTWELDVPNSSGVARWIWEIQPGGTYAFHAEGPGNVPSHSGIFHGRNGTWTLRSTTMAWSDSGTYQLLQDKTLSATGRLGTASWTRVAPAQPPVAAGGGPGDNSADTAGKPGVYTGSRIYAFLSRHTFDHEILSAPLKLKRTVTVDLGAEDKKEGVAGIVQGEIEGSISPATVSLVVYRDRTAALAARDINAVYDSKTFHMRRGEFTSSYGSTYGKRGDGTCISRLMIHESSRATVTCYLLVQYPTREPVMIESELSEQVQAGSNGASKAAVEKANDLLFSGLKQWEIDYPDIGGGSSQ